MWHIEWRALTTVWRPERAVQNTAFWRHRRKLQMLDLLKQCATGQKGCPRRSQHWTPLMIIRCHRLPKQRSVQACAKAELLPSLALLTVATALPCDAAGKIQRLDGVVGTVEYARGSCSSGTASRYQCWQRRWYVITSLWVSNVGNVTTSMPPTHQPVLVYAACAQREKSTSVQYRTVCWLM